MHAQFLIAMALLTSSAPVSAARWVERCAANTPESRQASAALKQLGDKIEALPPDRNPAPLVKQLEELLESRCFRIARDELSGRFDSGLSLTTWWKSGGEDWLSSVLRGNRELVLPPEARATLALDGKPEQPLATLLCALADPTCGLETGGWVARAEAALAARAQAAAVAQRKEATDPGEHRSPRGPADCAARAQKVLPEKRYQTWHACIEELHPKQDALPLGRVRAPMRGFLVVRGRRGHYSFCDEIRAYDLASGAAYVASSCSGLALAADGRVDGARTDSGRRAQLVTGRLPVDNLREAAWMALLLSKIENNKRVESFQVPIPADIKPQLPTDEGMVAGMTMDSMWFTSAQTQLTWAWLDGGRVLGQGKLTWPDSSDAAADYAVELLRIAEAGMKPGCPQSPPSPSGPLPPARLLAGEAPGVNRLDAPAGVRSVHSELLELLERAPRCAAPSSRP